MNNRKQKLLIANYIARINELINFLPQPYSHVKRMSKIRENLLRKYRNKLVLETINSEEKFIELATKIDYHSNYFNEHVTFQDLISRFDFDSEYKKDSLTITSSMSVPPKEKIDKNHRSRRDKH